MLCFKKKDQRDSYNILSISKKKIIQKYDGYTRNDSKDAAQNVDDIFYGTKIERKF